MDSGKRDKAAHLNWEYKQIAKEAMGSYGEKESQGILWKGLYCKVWGLSYCDINQRGNIMSEEEQNEIASLYLPCDYVGEYFCEDILHKMFGDERKEIRFADVYKDENQQVRRYLPLLTAFLMLRGRELVRGISVGEEKRLCYAAFWVFELDKNMEEEKQEELIKVLQQSICTAENIAVQESKLNQDVWNSDILKDYVNWLFKYFPQYCGGARKRIIESERDKLEVEIGNYFRKK